MLSFRSNPVHWPNSLFLEAIRDWWGAHRLAEAQLT
jgi:hypothetical protein